MIKFLASIAIVLLMLTAVVLAQDTLTETYNNDDFSFDYPAGWHVDDSGAFVRLNSPFTEPVVALLVFAGRDFTSQLTGDTAVAILRSAQTLIPDITGDPAPMTIGEREAAVAFMLTDELQGYAIVVPFSGGGYGLLLAATRPGAFAPFEPIVFAIAGTYNAALDQPEPTATPVTAAPSMTIPTAPQLTNYAQGWEAAIRELLQWGMVSESGGLVFYEPAAFLGGIGRRFTPLATNRPYSNVVMAADLTFTPGNPAQVEICTLSTRIQTDTSGDGVLYLDVGFASEGSLIVLDRFSEAEVPRLQATALGIDLTRSHHVLLWLHDEQLAVYLDGERVIDTTVISNRAGSYGITLVAHGEAARCEGENVWVYQFPAFEPGLCTVSTTVVVNRRTGPGTAFDRAGHMPTNTPLTAVAQARGEEDYIWWQLEDGTWVREDVVNAQGSCRTLPVVE